MGLIVSPWQDITVGVEWEPQAVFLQYKKMPVDFGGYRGLNYIVECQEIYSNIHVSLDGEYLASHFDGLISVDHGFGNIEVHSPLAALSHIQEACQIATNVLAEFTQWLSSELKTPVGFFFPLLSPDPLDFRPSKHVNVSGAGNHWLEEKYDKGPGGIDWVDLNLHHRQHLQFPYHMPITEEWMKRDRMYARDREEYIDPPEPTLICCSWSGRRVTVHQPLF